MCLEFLVEIFRRFASLIGSAGRYWSGVLCQLVRIHYLLSGDGFYLAIGGAIGEHAWGHINDVIHKEKFDVTLKDISEDAGMLSVQVGTCFSVDLVSDFIRHG